MGLQNEEVAQELTGLSPETEYTVCLLERNLNQTKGEETVGPAVRFETVGVLEAPTVTTPASEITDNSIKLQGVLNPGAPGVPGTYEFVYRRSSSECQRENPETHLEETEFATPTGVVVGDEGEVVPTVPVEVGGLEPNTAYTFCLLGRNEAGETAVGVPVTFTMLSSKPSVSSESFSNVSATGTTINAQVDTGGLPTTITVQYGTTDAYGSTTVGAMLPAGTTTATTQLSGLEPNTEYHFKVLLANGDGSYTGTDKAFRTLPANTNELPDSRAYEMVTPPDNDNSDVESPEINPNQSSEESQGLPSVDVFQASPDGSKITFPVLELAGAGGSAGHGDQYLAERASTGGWVQSSIQPVGYEGTYYQAFSSDLSIGIIVSGNTGEPEILPPLSPDAPGEGYQILYERVTSGKGYRPLITNAIKLNRSPNSPYDGGFGAHEVVTVGDQHSVAPAFAGGSADSKDLLFEVNDALLIGEGVLEKELEDDVNSEIEKGEQANYLYDEIEGRLSLVDVSPEGKVVPDATFGALPITESEPESLRHNQPDFSHVISNDGRFVYWTDMASGVMYVREDGTSTVQVSKGSARYWTASADGRYALYTEGEGSASELYRFDSESEAGHPQREVVTGAEAGVLGVLGASEDTNTVYFVAEGALSAANNAGVAPIAGEPNLYVISNGGTPVFIGTLSRQDGNEIQPFISTEIHASFGDWQPGLGQRTASVTSDGSDLVFMSNQSLSVIGYPHGYLSNGSEEVYVYSAATDQLFCASCGSTGEASSGIGFLPIGWHQTYLPQWISEGGDRVFFDSTSSLATQDTNGRQDVYEWEREGHGSCTHGYGSTGACVFLLSGGSSEANSWFAGASANGDDAFIVTRAKLVPEDENETFDLYDVRVNGVKPVTPPVCTGSGCQGVPAPPPLFATPPSVTFSGIGNFSISVGDAVKPKSKSKSLTRAQKLAKALKACERQKSHKKRVSCKAQARRLYGSRQKSGKSSGGAQGRKHA
jgi:hypothetical protein